MHVFTPLFSDTNTFTVYRVGKQIEACKFMPHVASKSRGYIVV